MGTHKTIKTPYVAADTNVIMSLAIYEKYGEEVRKILESNYYNTEEVVDLVKSNHKLRHEFYNSRTQGIQESLEYTALLYYNIRKGKIRLFITKTALGEMGLGPKMLLKGAAARLYKGEIEIQEFLENPQNNITVLTVKDEDAAQFALDKLKLSVEYVEVGAMDRTYCSVKEDYYPSKDAEIIAEASLFGLNIITYNEKHMIHFDCNANDGKGDFERATKIEEINSNIGLRFTSNRSQYKEPPHPVSVHSFMDRFKYRYKENKSFCIYPNINEETNEIEYNPLSI